MRVQVETPRFGSDGCVREELGRTCQDCRFGSKGVFISVRGALECGPQGSLEPTCADAMPYSIFGDAEPTSLDKQKKGVESNTRSYRISRQPSGPKYFLYRNSGRPCKLRHAT